MYLIDTNILIYFFDGKMTEAQKIVTYRILKASFTISVITKIEFLGFKEYMDESAGQKAKEFISNATVLQLSDPIIDKTIALKQQEHVKLGDAIIAATALEYGLTLVTRNTDDFKRLPVHLLNPFLQNL